MMFSSAKFDISYVDSLFRSEAAKKFDEKRHKELYIIVLLLYSTGIKKKEVVYLKYNDIYNGMYEVRDSILIIRNESEISLEIPCEIIEPLLTFFKYLNIQNVDDSYIFDEYFEYSAKHDSMMTKLRRDINKLRTKVSNIKKKGYFACFKKFYEHNISLQDKRGIGSQRETSKESSCKQAARVSVAERYNVDIRTLGIETPFSRKWR